MARNLLFHRDIMRFPRTPACAIIDARSGAAGAGLGHNGAQIDTSPVVPCVVGYLATKSTAYVTPQRHNGEIEPPTCVCARARARVWDTHVSRCAVVPISYLLEKEREKEGIAHNARHNGAENGRKTVVGSVVGQRRPSLNPLFSNRKGGF
ncbi:hypothetical protein [Cribrihabitans marinus]|uniref:hypothetical protein n=1 Tax=Cribrihabitans marinus TaxID=1227549 RepID=UPI00115FA119|nr:hypothetical protein [Cribrihabitans marinus]GGH36219.1 hypothetical protein GCM10010973_30060 [Cribrihabitans marinus]